MFPGCHIEPESDPTEPTLEEVDLYSYPKAKYVWTESFYQRAKKMKQEASLKEAAFYSHLEVVQGEK
jgi:hypothetical protein